MDLLAWISPDQTHDPASGTGFLRCGASVCQVFVSAG